MRCLGPTRQRAQEQAAQLTKTGCPALIITPPDTGGKNDNGTVCVDGRLAPEALEHLTDIAAIIMEGSDIELKPYRAALAKRGGPILPLVCALDEIEERCVHERHTCIDTTAAGGNATLLASY